MLILLEQAARILGVVLASAAGAYLVLANWCVGRFGRDRLARLPATVLPALTVLKPLHGHEADLEDNLRSFLEQAYPGKLQIVFGVQSEHDPALPVARRLAAGYPHRDIAIVVDATVHGPNRKAGNLANMAAMAKHELIAVSDSDARLASDGLARAVEPLADEDVGAVTCLYRSTVPEGAGVAARLAALYIDGWILPSAVVAATLAPVEGCYGPLSVIRRSVLDEAGGFARMAHLLADDFELGQITVRQGLRVELAPCIVPTVVHETSLRELCHHELRWARTTRATEPMAYAFAVVTWIAPLVALLLLPTGRPVLGLLVLALLTALRAGLLINVQRRLDARIGLPELAPWAIVAREVLCFVIWAAAYFGGRISWRGAALEVRPGGRLVEAAPSAIQG